MAAAIGGSSMAVGTRGFWGWAADVPGSWASGIARGRLPVRVNWWGRPRGGVRARFVACQPAATPSSCRVDYR
jgi:hypothetical protein